MCRQDAILNKNTEATEKLLARAEQEKVLFCILRISVTEESWTNPSLRIFLLQERLAELKAGGVDSKAVKAAAEWRSQVAVLFASFWWTSPQRLCHKIFEIKMQKQKNVGIIREDATKNHVQRLVTYYGVRACRMWRNVWFMRSSKEWMSSSKWTQKKPARWKRKRLVWIRSCSDCRNGRDNIILGSVFWAADCI